MRLTCVSVLHLTEPNDFSNVNSLITFSAGVTVGETRCVTVNILDDTRVEDDEYFMFTIQNQARTRIEGSTSIRINILDNDGKQKSTN